MTVEKGVGVTYIWFDVPENALENIEPWTEVAKKIRSIQDDIYRAAIAGAPVGRPRFDQAKKIRSSHYKGAGIGKTGPKQYRQVVGNSAPHAEWVHEGTEGERVEVVQNGKWMGPVLLGRGPGRLWMMSAGPEEGEFRTRDTSRYVVNEEFAIFHHYLWRGQKPNGWLARAGQAAYRMPGNH